METPWLTMAPGIPGNRHHDGGPTSPARTDCPHTLDASYMGVSFLGRAPQNGWFQTTPRVACHESSACLHLPKLTETKSAPSLDTVKPCWASRPKTGHTAHCSVPFVGLQPAQFQLGVTHSSFGAGHPLFVVLRKTTRKTGTPFLGVQPTNPVGEIIGVCPSL